MSPEALASLIRTSLMSEPNKIIAAVLGFNAIIEAVESRCMACDGPVTPTLREMREDELSALWQHLQTIKSEMERQGREIAPRVLKKRKRHHA